MVTKDTVGISADVYIIIALISSLLKKAIEKNHSHFIIYIGPLFVSIATLI